MTAADSAGLPIDPAEPMATQSRHALMIAHEKGWLTYRCPVDMRETAHIRRALTELGEDAQLPTDDGVYYLVYCRPADGKPFPVLVPEGEVRAFVFAVAAGYSSEDAASVQYRHGTLPL